MEKLEICTEFIQLCHDTDQKLRASVEIAVGTNFNKGGMSEANKELSDYLIKNEAPNILNEKCVDKTEIHLTKVNERHEKIKEKYQCSVCGKLMASGWV